MKMGLYFDVILFYGAVINESELKTEPEQKYVKRIVDDQIIVCVPSVYYSVESASFVGSNDLKGKYSSLEQARDTLQSLINDRQVSLEVPAAEQAELNELVNETHWYLAQACCYSDDLSTSISISIIKRFN